MHYYQFNISDWILHTSHLTLEEEGVYRRLLDFYYDTEQAIPKITQPVIRRLRLGSYMDIVDLVLDEFFTLKDDGWHNFRADLEILAYTEKAKRARENGKNGGRPKKQNKTKQRVIKSNNPKITQSVILDNPEITGSKANYKLLTINQELETNNKKIPFDMFYKKYPIKKSKATAKKKWESLAIKKQESAIAGIDKYISTVSDINYAVHPSTYLSQERWNDEPTNSTNFNQPVGQSQALRNIK